MILKEAVKAGREHPKAVKMELARELASRFHGDAAALAAAQEFDAIFKNKGRPEQIDSISLKKEKGGHNLVDVLLEAELVASKSEARRLIKQGGVTVDDQRVEDVDYRLLSEGEPVLRVGKRRFKKVIFIQ